MNWNLVWAYLAGMATMWVIVYVLTLFVKYEESLRNHGDGP